MIEKVQEQNYAREAQLKSEPRREQAQNAQQNLAAEMLRQQTTGTQSRNNQLLQLLSSVQPQQAIEKTAQSQIEQGYLDIRV